MADQITIGLSPAAHELLKDLQNRGLFAEMADAYRLAIAFALAKRVAYADLPDAKRQTILNTGSLDPDRILYNTVDALLPNEVDPVYRRIERLAEWGTMQIHHLLVDRQQGLSVILSEIRAGA